jgi:protein phosphatase
MGTTCTCLVLVPQGALVGHVGDSRAYRLRDNTFEQLTFDHSLVWETATASHLSEENLSSVIPKNIITRSLGPHESVNVDLEGPFDLREGDVFLVCTDGLSGQLSDEEIGTIIGALSPADAVQTLVDIANLRGGPDNISVIVAKVESPPESSGTRPAESVRSTDESKSTPLGPGAWLAMIACVAVVAVSGWNRWVVGILLGIAGFGTAVIISLARHFQSSSTAAVTDLAGPYGNGPYRTFDCTPSRSVVDALAEFAGQLRNLSQQDEFAVELDWAPIEVHQKLALEAVETDDYRAAVAEFGHVIRVTMKQLRERRATVTTQSGIRLDLE